MILQWFTTKSEIKSQAFFVIDLIVLICNFEWYVFGLIILFSLISKPG